MICARGKGGRSSTVDASDVLVAGGGNAIDGLAAALMAQLNSNGHAANDEVGGEAG
jgi:hypothetical protein